MTNQNSQIAKNGSTAMAEPDEDYLPGIDSSDLIFPEFRLCQSSSQPVKDGIAEVGQFYCPQTGEVKDVIEAIVLYVQKPRTKWNPEELGPPVCWSDNGKTAGPGSAYEGRECATCEFRAENPFGMTPDEKREACLPGFSFLCMDPENDSPFLVRFNGTSVQSARNWITMVKTRMGGKPFSFVTRISGEERSNKWGSFCVQKPMIDFKKPIEGDRLDNVAAIAHSLLHSGQEIHWAPNASEPSMVASDQSVVDQSKAAPAKKAAPKGKTKSKTPTKVETPTPSPDEPASVLVGWDDDELPF